MNISKNHALAALSVLLKNNITTAKNLENRTSLNDKKKYINAIKGVVIYSKIEKNLTKS